MKRYANQSSGRWIYKGDEIEREFTKHTEVLYFLYKIGKKLGYKVFVGKREQSEDYGEKKLKDYVDYTKLNFLKEYTKDKIKRIEMIDMIWLNSKNEITYSIEVENSTKFTSGIQRSSNLKEDIKKIMVIPDKRNNEFKNIKDPLFVENFKKYNWKYLFYSEIDDLKSSRDLSNKVFEKFLKELK